MTLLDKMRDSEFFRSNQPRFSMIATGVLIIVAAILVFNYFDKINTNQESEQQSFEQKIEESSASANQDSNEKKPYAYIVGKGDTLWDIAQKQLDDPLRWKEIAQLNSIEKDLAGNPTIDPGQILVLPEKQTASQEAENEIASTQTDGQENGEVLAATAIGGKELPQTYSVERGDTLWGIAQKIYGDPYKWTLIENANTLGRLPDGTVLIHRGNVLIIPANNP